MCTCSPFIWMTNQTKKACQQTELRKPSAKLYTHIGHVTISTDAYMKTALLCLVPAHNYAHAEKHARTLIRTHADTPKQNKTNTCTRLHVWPN